MIRIPITTFNNSATKDVLYVEVTESNLPTNYQKIIHLLARERASIEYWLEIAVS